MSETIFAPLTIKGRCSLFVIRISGSKVNDCLKALGIKKELKPQHASLRNLYYKGEVLDQALIVFFKAPNSFTGEDVCELNLHCSSYIIDKVYEILLKVDGVRFAGHGEFSKRAFLNGKLDLVEAEAICDLVDSKNELQHKQAINQLLGKNSNFFNSLRNDLLDIQTNLEALIDFPEDEIDEGLIHDISNKIAIFKANIQNILKDNNVAEKVKEGINIAIIGEPNAGKSSFLNFLAKRDVAIVSNIAGTTRDIIETKLNINGFDVNIFDTAGIRETSDVIEEEGVKRAVKTASNADLKILIIDVNNFNLNSKITDLIDENTLILINKIDLINQNELNKLKCGLKYNNTIIEISIKDEQNLDKVIDYITQFIEKNITPFIGSNITHERYRIELEKVVEYIDKIDFTGDMPIEIIAENIRLAAFCFGKITGQINTEEILNNIFSKFCIGK